MKIFRQNHYLHLSTETFMLGAQGRGLVSFEDATWPRDRIELVPDMVVHASAYANSTMTWTVAWKGCLVYLYAGNGKLAPTVAAPTQQRAHQILNELKELYPPTTPPEERVRVTIWANSQNGPVSRNRSLDAPTWDDIQGNYSTNTAAALAKLAMWKPKLDNGKFMLWYGPPGTGKSFAIRAMAQEWKDWADLHIVADPEEFFGHDPNYLFAVTMSNPTEDFPYECDDDSYDAKGRWQVLVLEDSGELLAIDAKTKVGQGLSRFLNFTDGLIGQGLRTLVLITTNEDYDSLHPAVRRPGRCIHRVGFDKLTRQESAEWCTRMGTKREAYQFSEPCTLADLYATSDSIRTDTEPKQIGFGKA